MRYLTAEVHVADTIAFPAIMTISITSGIFEWGVGLPTHAEFSEFAAERIKNGLCAMTRCDHPLQIGIPHFAPPSPWPFYHSECIDDERVTYFPLATEGLHPILDVAIRLPNHSPQASLARLNAIRTYSEFLAGSHPMHASKVNSRWASRLALHHKLIPTRKAANDNRL